MINFLKKYKKISIILILTLMLVMLSNNVYATDSVIQGAQEFLSKGTEDVLSTYQVKKVSDSVYNVLLAIGSVIVVIVGAILGIQFIMGSVEEKVKVKEALIPYIIGSVVIFGSFAIWKVVVITLSNASSTSQSYIDESSSESSTHESSSGRTHGGGGGKF